MSGHAVYDRSPCDGDGTAFVSEPEDGTTEFKAATLRDIIDAEEGGAARAAGPKERNRQLIVIVVGVGAAVVVVVILLLVAGGGGGGKDPNSSEKTVPANVRLSTGILTSAMTKNHKVSVCSTETGLVAKDVVIRGRHTEKQGIAVLDVLEVAATPEEAGRLTGLKPYLTKVVGTGAPCPPLDTTTTAPAPAEPVPTTTAPGTPPTSS
jgi:hypothetical protein